MNDKYKLVNDFGIGEDINLLKNIIDCDIFLIKRNFDCDTYIISKYNLKMSVYYNGTLLIDFGSNKSIFDKISGLLYTNNNIMIDCLIFGSLYKRYSIVIRGVSSFKHINYD